MSNFLVLHFISAIFRLLGWLAVLIGLGYFIGYEGIYEPNLPGHRFDPQDAFQIMVGAGVFLGGLIFVAMGEGILVSLAIERHTRETERNTRQITSSFKKLPL